MTKSVGINSEKIEINNDLLSIHCPLIGFWFIDMRHNVYGGCI